MDVQCSMDAEWNSDERSGKIIMLTCNVRYATLDEIDGSGGSAPETLLIAAISSSYSIALSNILRIGCLPQTRVSVHGSGTIVNSCGRAQFDRVVISPTIQGADLCRQNAYQDAALAAREHCLIGRSIRGNVAYVVGDVVLRHSDG